MSTVKDAEVAASGSPAAKFDGFMSYSHSADDLLAPRLQHALQTFAKPWWKRRALRVFRDQASLSANPHLWSSITQALDSSEWFIVLVSPQAAASPWVEREISYWLEHRDPNRILPVLTDGVLVWDTAAGKFDSVSAVPPALATAFGEEPRWVDMSWPDDETQLDMRNARFREAVADIASALRGVSKDDLESEEVRQHRRTRRTAWAAGIALAVLILAAAAGAVIAVEQRNEAQAQRGLAEAEAVRAVTAEALARSRELGASAIGVLGEDPELSVLLGLQAINETPAGQEQPVEALNALREGVHASKLRQRWTASPGGGWVWLDISPDGDRLAVVSELEGTVALVEAAFGREVWKYQDSTTVDSFSALSFSADGGRIAIGVYDSGRERYQPSLPATPRPGASTDDGLPPRVVILDAADGGVISTILYPSCADAVPTPRFSPDGRWLAVAGIKGMDCLGWEVALLDAETLEPGPRMPTSDGRKVSWSSDGSLLAIGSIDAEPSTTLFEVGTLQPILEVPQPAGVVSPDGAWLALDDQFALDLIDVGTGARVDNLAGLDQLFFTHIFTPDGARLVVGTLGEEILVFDVLSGEILERLGSAGVSVSLACDQRCDTLYQSTVTGEVKAWELGETASGEFNSRATGYWVNADSVTTTANAGAFLGYPLYAVSYPEVFAFDPATASLGPTRRPTNTNYPASLPDGRIVLFDVSETTPEWGPVVVWDPVADEAEELLGCWTSSEAMEASDYASVEAPLCVDRPGDYFLLDRALLSPDQSSLLLASPSGDVRIFDARDLSEVGTLRLPPGHLAVLAHGGDWLLSTDGTVAHVVDVKGGTVVATLPIGIFDSWAAVSADGERAVVAERFGAISIFDTRTWEIIISFETKPPLRGIALSPDGRRLLTADSDAYVRIWDTDLGSELVRIPLPGPSDGYWLDDSHVVVGTTSGLWTTLTLDLGELRELAMSRLTRGFNAEECAAYRIDPCPDLAALQGR